MGLYTPGEIIAQYTESGGKKARRSLGELLALSVLAGAVIAFGSAATNTVAYGMPSPSLVRLLAGLLFPFGLGIVMLTGMELFTGNCMMVVPRLEGKITWGQMLRNWILVFGGNLAGAFLIAAGCALFGQFQSPDSQLAVFTLRLAATKCALSWPRAFVMGILCNILVCLGVLCAISAKDTIGKIAGAYLPVALFVLCGFEHCVANMYYIPAGLLARSVPEYALAAGQAGVDLAALTWGNFFLRNLVPVTLGNILGGALVGILLWLGHVRLPKPN